MIEHDFACFIFFIKRRYLLSICNRSKQRYNKQRVQYFPLKGSQEKQ